MIEGLTDQLGVLYDKVSANEANISANGSQITDLDKRVTALENK
jgi:hypothetical protein